MLSAHLFQKFNTPLEKNGIKTVYTPHKIIGEDVIDGIEIKPCPLYAVSIEYPNKNKNIKDINFLNYDRPILYSFVGSYSQYYISDIRNKIFQLPKKEDVHIVNRGKEWHFDPIVYNAKQNKNGELNESSSHKEKTYEYNELLLKSKYTLCPSGTGPNSIRFWEAMSVGSIPVLLSDTLELPKHDLWYNAIIKVKEKDVNTVDAILRKISPEEEEKRRINCLKIYEHFKDNYKNEKKEIIHYCCGSYDLGNYGGVARYDYHIKLAFPERKFFTGPRQKNQMLEYLKTCKNPIVITDNHLACDIPNEYKCFLVHHGVAQTHAEREPTWNKYWKDLCCNGQKKMLSYRNPENTIIISISQFCTDEFTKYYENLYENFKQFKVLHTSELNEEFYKKEWNSKPIVLGHWSNMNKGLNTINILKIKNDFTFNQLRINIDRNGIDSFNKRKQDIYLKNDIYLNLSLCEGFSYSALDALLCGLVIVSTNVGFFYKDIPEDCFVKIEWEKRDEVGYIYSKLKYAWENKEEISRKGREWYMKNCRFVDWVNKMRKIII